MEGLEEIVKGLGGTVALVVGGVTGFTLIAGGGN